MEYSREKNIFQSKSEAIYWLEKQIEPFSRMITSVYYVTEWHWVTGKPSFNQIKETVTLFIKDMEKYSITWEPKPKKKTCENPDCANPKITIESGGLRVSLEASIEDDKILYVPDISFELNWAVSPIREYS